MFSDERKGLLRHVSRMCRTFCRRKRLSFRVDLQQTTKNGIKYDPRKEKQTKSAAETKQN